MSLGSRRWASKRNQRLPFPPTTPPTTTAAATTTGLVNARVSSGDDPRRPCANTNARRSRQGAHASLPLIRLVSSSVLPCCQILCSCRTSISLPPWDERHQAIAATKAAETTTSLRGSEVSVFLQSKTCVERRL